MAWERRSGYQPFARHSVDPASYTVRGGSFGIPWPEINLTPYQRIITQEGTGVVTDGDRIVIRDTDTLSVTDYQAQVQWPLDAPYTVEGTWSVSDPTRAEVSPTGQVTHLADGPVSLIYTPHAIFGLRPLTVPLVMKTEGGVVDTTIGWVEGSLAHHLQESIASRVSGKDRETRKMFVAYPSNSHPLYSYNGVSSIYLDMGGTEGPQHHTPLAGHDEYVRNPAFWGADVDWSGISVGIIPHSSGLNQPHLIRATPKATLLSPWHYVAARHYQPSVGQDMYFVSMDNQVWVGRIAAWTHISSPYNSYPYKFMDVSVGIFETPAPEWIRPLMLWPASVEGLDPSLPYLPTGRRNIVCVATDQQNHAQIYTFNHGWHTVNYSGHLDPAHAAFVDQPEDNKVWTELGLEYYDSGSPGVSIYQGDLVLNTLWTTISNGPSYISEAITIQETMDALSSDRGTPAQVIQYADLSGMPTF